MPAPQDDPVAPETVLEPAPAESQNLNLLRRVSTGFLWAQAGNVLQALVGIALTILVMRRLGPEDYGAYGLLITVLTITRLITQLGFNDALGRYIPIYESSSERGKTVYLLRTMLAARGGISVAALLVTFLSSGLLSTQLHVAGFHAYFPLLAAIFVVWELAQHFTSFFNALLQLKKIVIYNLLMQGSTLALTLVMFQVWGVSITAVLYATAAGGTLGLVYCLYESRKYLFQARTARAPLGAVIRFGLQAWIASLAQLIGLGRDLDVLLLGGLAPSSAEIGYYNAAVMPAVRTHGFLFSSWLPMTLPVLCEVRERNGEEGAERAWGAYLKLMGMLAIPVFTFMFVFAGPVVRVLLTNAYEKSINLLRVQALITLVLTIVGGGLNTNFLYTIGKSRFAWIVRIVLSALRLGLAVVLILRWQALGAMLAFGLCNLAVVLLEAYYLARHVRLHPPIAFLGKLLSAALGSSLPLLLIPTTTLGMLLLVLALFLVLYAAMLFLLKPASATDRQMLEKLAPRFSWLLRLFSRAAP